MFISKPKDTMSYDISHASFFPMKPFQLYLYDIVSKCGYRQHTLSLKFEVSIKVSTPPLMLFYQQSHSGSRAGALLIKPPIPVMQTPSF